MFKYLGVQNFNFVIKKVAKKVGLLGRLSKKMTAWSIITVYKAIIAPHIDYCSSMLFMNTDSELSKLQVLQNKVMRLILKCSKYTHIKDMLSALNFQSVKQRIIFNTLVLIFKIKNQLLPNYLNSILKLNSDVHERSMRRRSQFRLPLFLRSRSQNSVFYRGLKLFNELPDEIRRCVNLMQFKKSCSIYVKMNF